MDLFDTEVSDDSATAHDSQRPLPYRLRPRGFDEVLGQPGLTAPGSALRRAVERGQLHSLILFGPPGCGKTALAQVIAATSGAAFRRLNAVTGGLPQLKPILAEAARLRAAGRPPTLLFVDEIHRFNKVQQAALLPDTERGNIVLIGASTENPFHSLTPPLRSRSQLYRLDPLGEDDLGRLLDLALTDIDRGLGALPVEVTRSARATLIGYANGDGRRLLASLELCVLGAEATTGAPLRVTEDEVRRHLQYGGRRYDRSGDEHYDTISAFIKSVRGSDPDAAVYWLAKMIEGGEDPRFIARRLVILAAEDVGLADPAALPLADAAFSAVERIGMPEASLILSEAALYLATAPKSNSATVAIGEAAREIRERPTLAVPLHLRDTHYRGAGSLGHGVGYLYPHDYPGHWVPQIYLPESRSFYHPSDQGFERHIAERMKQRPTNKLRDAIEPSDEPTTAPDDGGPIDNTPPR